MSDENEQHENDPQADASNADETVDFEPLTATYGSGIPLIPPH